VAGTDAQRAAGQQPQQGTPAAIDSWTAVSTTVSAMLLQPDTVQRQRQKLLMLFLQANIYMGRGFCAITN